MGLALYRTETGRFIFRSVSLHGAHKSRSHRVKRVRNGCDLGAERVRMSSVFCKRNRCSGLNSGSFLGALENILGWSNRLETFPHIQQESVNCQSLRKLLIPGSRWKPDEPCSGLDKSSPVPSWRGPPRLFRRYGWFCRGAGSTFRSGAWLGLRHFPGLAASGWRGKDGGWG